MDLHTDYAPDYVKESVEVLKKQQADAVGGAWQANGTNYLQNAIALAFHSPFSSGGASSHDINFEGEVDSVYLGCWGKNTLERIGLFDEELVRNQDDELSLRLVRSKGKVWQSRKIKSWYYPRSSLKGLFKQYMQYGYWKVRVIQKHKMPASFRHLVPGVFLGIVVVLSLLSIINKSALVLLAGLIFTYILINCLASIFTCSKAFSLKYLIVMPLVFGAFHFGYGYGFLRGILDFRLLRKKGQLKFSKITRI